MQNIIYHVFEKLIVDRPVNRIDYLVQSVVGQRVLDLGAYDETAIDRKNNDLWVHGCMAQVASTVIGVDNSQKLTTYKTITHENAYILKDTFDEILSTLDLAKIDVIVAGEFIEHIDQPLSFFKKIKSHNELSSKKIIITTPNATSIHNIFLGMMHRESTHQDHLHIYSYKTLHTLCARAGFHEWNIRYYHVSFPEYIQKNKGIKKYFFIFCQKCINFVENIFPMLSGGLIVEITI